VCNLSLKASFLAFFFEFYLFSLWIRPIKMKKIVLFFVVSFFAVRAQCILYSA